MELDYSVGHILLWLKRLGIENDTFVFFTSDNGAALMSGPNEGKHYKLIPTCTQSFSLRVSAYQGTCSLLYRCVFWYMLTCVFVLLIPQPGAMGHSSVGKRPPLKGA